MQYLQYMTFASIKEAINKIDKVTQAFICKILYFKIQSLP